MVERGENGTVPNCAGLKIHHGGAEPAGGHALPDAWRGDAAVFCSVLERMGSDVERWRLAAATQALDGLVLQLFADCRTDNVSTAAWDRVVLLATLLGYREVLTALGGNSQGIAKRLARRPDER